MGTNKQFSIIIPAYNEEKYIAESIKYAQKQQGNFDTEIIVVNNASTDNTKQIAESMGVLVVDEPRKGVGQARKTGTGLAQGEYILNIDADTHLPEDYLQQVYNRFQKDLKLACIGGQYYFYDAPWWKDILRIPVHWGFWLYARLVSLGRIGPMGNNMCFKKTTYNKTIGFDINLKYGEDASLCFKLSKIGKIRLDMSLKCKISVRRFTFDKKLFIYVINFFKLCVTGQPVRNELSENR